MNRLTNQKRINLVLIKAGGGVLYRYDKGTPIVLLIKRNGIWDLPKGKQDEGESISDCAVREVAEETGSDIPPILKSFLCETYHEYRQDGIDFGKTTFWYAMVARNSSDLSPQQEEGITDLKWVELDRAFDLVGFENLRKVLDAFSAWLDSLK